MISYIKGEVLVKGKGFLIVKNQGIGYKVFVSQKTQEKVQQGETKEFFTHFFNKNEQAELYGFLSFQELEIFEIVGKISGVGPKAALKVASLGGADKLQKAVETQNFDYFSNIKGLGRKKIQKIILELGGSLKGLVGEKTIKKEDESLRALTSLGFSTSEAKRALSKISKDIILPEEKVKEALKFFN